MRRDEFVKALAYITAGCGRELAPASLEVYFDCLGDLTYDVMLLAAKRVLLSHKWATFPSVAELREAATTVAAGRVSELSPAEAWALAWRAAANTDPEIEGSFERATRNVPAIVVRAMKAFGVCSLCAGGEPVGVLRGQFLRIYEQIAAGDKAAQMLPPTTRRAIEERAEKSTGAALKLANWSPEMPK